MALPSFYALGVMAGSFFALRYVGRALLDAKDVVYGFPIVEDRRKMIKEIVR